MNQKAVASGACGNVNLRAVREVVVEVAACDMSLSHAGNHVAVTRVAAVPFRQLTNAVSHVTSHRVCTFPGLANGCNVTLHSIIYSFCLALSRTVSRRPLAITRGPS